MNEQPMHPSEETDETIKQEELKSRRLFKKILFWMLGIALLTFAFFAYVIFISMPKNDVTPEQQKVEREKTVSAQTIIDESEKYVNAQFKKDFATLTTTKQSGISPTYKPNNTDYYVVVEDAHTLNVTPRPEIATQDVLTAENLSKPIADGLNKYLTTQQKLLPTDQWPKDTDTPTHEYQSDTAICTLSSSYIDLQLSCADKASYDKTAKELKPFAEAMDKEGKLDSRTSLRTPIIKDSPVKGYQNATISISGYGAVTGGFAGLFYKNDSGNWRYFIGTQNVLSCEIYNTDDLKNAFAGETCADKNGASDRIQPVN